MNIGQAKFLCKIIFLFGLFNFRKQAVQFMIKNYAKIPFPYQDIILPFELKTILKVNNLNLYREDIPWKRPHRIQVADSLFLESNNYTFSPQMLFPIQHFLCFLWVLFYEYFPNSPLGPLFPVYQENSTNTSLSLSLSLSLTHTHTHFKVNLKEKKLTSQQVIITRK